MPIPVFVFQIGELVKYHQTALPFEYPLEFAYTHLRRNRYQHMDMVFTRICLYDFHSIASLAYPPQYISYPRFILPVYDLPAIFRRKVLLLLRLPVALIVLQEFIFVHSFKPFFPLAQRAVFLNDKAEREKRLPLPFPFGGDSI